MGARVLLGEPDCDEILGWLEAHSVGVAQGVPAHLLHSKWVQLGRPAGRLGACLQRLFEDDWIALTPAVDPPHLRFSAEGYRRLLEAPLAPSATAPARTPEPLPARESPAASDDGEPETAPGFEHSDRGYVRHGRPLTEIALRNQILSIYRELRLRAESRLIGVTLSRYWQEMGLRAGDLRCGLDVLTRDGYLRQRIDGMDRFWQLTPEGERFIDAPPTVDALFDLAPELLLVAPCAAPDELRRLALHAFAEGRPAAGRALGYAALQAHWQRTGFDQNALLHGLDLLIKDGHLRLAAAEPPVFELTAAGADFARREYAVISRLLGKLSRALGG